jgi:hypothetical protein
MDDRERFRAALEEILWQYESVEIGLTVFLLRGLQRYDEERSNGAPIDPKGFIEGWTKTNLPDTSQTSTSEENLSSLLFGRL